MIPALGLGIETIVGFLATVTILGEAVQNVLTASPFRFARSLDKLYLYGLQSSMHSIRVF